MAMQKKYDFFINKIYKTDNNTLGQYVSVDEYAKEYGLFSGIILTSLAKSNLVSTEYSKELVNFFRHIVMLNHQENGEKQM